MLLLKGGRDTHSSASDVVPRFARLGLDVEVFPKADHMLLEWPLGPGTPPPTFADGYLERVVTWIHRR